LGIKTLYYNLALLYESQGRYGEAEPLYLTVRDLEKQVLGEDHPSYLIMLSNLAGLYISQANFLKFPQVTPLYIQVLRTQLRVLGWKHPSTRTTLMNLVYAVFMQVAIGWGLIKLSIALLQHPSWFALLRAIGYLFLIWFSLRQALTQRTENFFRRRQTTRNRKHKQR
jgi:Tetratricopeptide repeat